MHVDIQNLCIAFPSATGISHAVRNVSLSIGNEKLGIVGESGSGKSLTARSILRLLPDLPVVAAPPDPRAYYLLATASAGVVGSW